MKFLLPQKVPKNVLTLNTIEQKTINISVKFFNFQLKTAHKIQFFHEKYHTGNYNYKRFNKMQMQENLP